MAARGHAARAPVWSRCSLLALGPACEPIIKVDLPDSAIHDWRWRHDGLLLNARALA